MGSSPQRSGSSPARRQDFATWHQEHLLPMVVDAGADIVASFVNSARSAANTYPALPVRH